MEFHRWSGAGRPFDKGLVALAATLMLVWQGAAVAALGPAPGVEGAHQRVALVIGNGSYAARPLANPVNDARAVSRLLEQAGFHVRRLENVGADAMRDALRRFRARAASAETAVFYFSGHGDGRDGGQRLIPVDAVAADRAWTEGIALDTVLRSVSSPGTEGRRVVIVDACRESDGPVGERAALPAGTLLALGTGAGGKADDGGAGLGLFTASVLRSLQRGGDTLDGLLRRAAGDVVQVSGASQTPELYLSAGWDSPFWTGTPGTPLAATPTPGGSARGLLPKDGEDRFELEFWNSVKNSKNPADYEAYLEAYPDGRFAPLAKARAAYLRKSEEKSKPPTEPPAQPAREVVTEPAPAPKPVARDDGVLEMDAEYVVVRTANVREQASANSNRVGRLERGARVAVTGRVKDRNWFRIEKPGGGTGFVYGDLVREPPPPKAPATVARAAPAPAATPTRALSTPSPATPQAASEPRQQMAAVRTPAPAAAPRPVMADDKTFRDCKQCPEMVPLSPGSFVMGSSSGDNTERPAHRVNIRYPFALGRFEVTVGEWNACLKAGGCDYQPRKSLTADVNAPMRNVSWRDAQQYVKWLSDVTGHEYRLPSEAEWEYAARAGTRTRFWWGDSVGRGNADCKNCGGEWNRKRPADVDAYAPNAFGLHGMNGGVWEWGGDCWYNSHDRAPVDGRARQKKNCTQRVLRGGSWRNDASYVHSASRFMYDADVRYVVNGFRVARSMK